VLLPHPRAIQRSPRCAASAGALVGLVVPPGQSRDLDDWSPVASACRSTHPLPDLIAVPADDVSDCPASPALSTEMLGTDQTASVRQSLELTAPAALPPSHCLATLKMFGLACAPGATSGLPATGGAPRCLVRCGCHTRRSFDLGGSVPSLVRRRSAASGAAVAAGPSGSGLAPARRRAAPKCRVTPRRRPSTGLSLNPLGLAVRSDLRANPLAALVPL
jgi:hypothetical protein